MLRQSPAELKRKYDDAARATSASLKRDYPGLVGILMQGSIARGQPGPFSDVDLMGITVHGKKPPEFSYYFQDIYISVGFRSVAELEKEFKDPNQFFWARGSAATSTRILYDPMGVLRRIILRGKNEKPSHRVIEGALWNEYHHIIEYSGKLRNGWFKHDEYLTRYAARVIAQHAEYSVFALNDLSIISENNVWHIALKAKKKPGHFGTDYPIALGLKGTIDTGMVYRSALRLSQETLRLIKREFGAKARSPRFKMLLAERLEKHGL